MELFCRICGSSEFRSSRFRFRPAYLLRLIFLRFPVRCLNCHERAFTFLSQYLILRRAQREYSGTM